MYLLQEKKGGTKKRQKGGNLSNIQKKITNIIIEEIHKIDGSKSLNDNKMHFMEIIKRLNSMINNKIPLDMNYTGINPNIGEEDRPLRSILFSYYNELPKVKTEDKTKFEQVYIELLTIFLIGFINNQEINNQEGYDIAYNFEHSIHNMINLICDPKYVHLHLKESILENMQKMVNNPKLNQATKEKVQNVFDSDVFNTLCYPIKPTDATIITEGVMTKKQKQIWNRNQRQFWNSIHSRRRIKNPNVTKATPVKYPIYGTNNLTLTLPEGIVDDRGIGLPYINLEEPDPQQIAYQRRRLLNEKIRGLRSNSLGGIKRKQKRKTRKIV